MFLDRITVFCFAASYGVALTLELWNLMQHRPILQRLSFLFAAAGLLAHAIFLSVQRLSLSSRYGAFLYLAFFVVILYAFALLRHRKVAWGVFVLPLALGLVVSSGVFVRDASTGEQPWSLPFLASGSTNFWYSVHGTLLLLAAAGLCLSFSASAMYLVQARRLKKKSRPGHGLQLLSLERLSEIHHRAILVVFPLLTAGIIIGTVLVAQAPTRADANVRIWADPRVVSTLLLWFVLAILVWLRFRSGTPGRRVAVLTIVALILLVVTVALPHTVHSGGGVS